MLHLLASGRKLARLVSLRVVDGRVELKRVILVAALGKTLARLTRRRARARPLDARLRLRLRPCPRLRLLEVG